MSGPCLEADSWLAGHLGKPAFHLVGSIAADDAATIAALLPAKPIFVDAKVSVDDHGAAVVLGRLGFVLIDTNLKFSRPRAGLPEQAAPGEILFARPDMADAIGEIAAQSFVYDRFHCDPQIAHETAGALKREWARNFFAGKRGKWMVVARDGGTVAGFLQLLQTREDDLVIDLIAVGRPYRGRGLARAMIAFAAQRCDIRGGLVVGTQVANTASVRLYEDLGFRLAGAQHVFHYHGLAS